ncbi:hypothetical protein AB4144_28005 [Rhizobiaceae sp. 2RAB30]
MRTDSTKTVSRKASAASKGLMRNAAKEERKVEAKAGKPLPKGEKRVIERSKSSDGKSPGVKQR